MNLHKRLRDMVTVACLHFWNGDTHAMNFQKNVDDFETEDHMNHIGEFLFNVNETCLSCDHRSFMVAPSDKDAHNPFLMHITPSEMTWKEKREYVPGELKQARKQRRKEKQRDNKRKAYQAEEEDEDDGPWINFTTQEWLDYQPEHRRQPTFRGLWSFFSIFVLAVETEKQMSVHFYQKKITQNDFSVQLFNFS